MVQATHVPKSQLRLDTARQGREVVVQHRRRFVVRNLGNNGQRRRLPMAWVCSTIPPTPHHPPALEVAVGLAKLQHVRAHKASTHPEQAVGVQDPHGELCGGVALGGGPVVRLNSSSEVDGHHSGDAVLVHAGQRATGAAKSGRGRGQRVGT